MPWQVIDRLPTLFIAQAAFHVGAKILKMTNSFFVARSYLHFHVFIPLCRGLR